MIVLLSILFVLVVLYFMTHRKDSVYNRFKGNFKYIKQKGGIGVDMAYCISMPNRISHAKKKMKELGGNYKIFNAIRPELLSAADYATMSLTYFPGFKSFNKKTKLPVALSFFMCYYDALINGYDTICIFEDDIDFPLGVDKIKKSISEFKNIDHEMLFLGYCHLNCDGDYSRVSEELIDVSGTQLVCNHALCIKRTFIEKYLKGKPLFYQNHNDQVLSMFCIRNGIGTTVPTVPLVNQKREEMGSQNGNNALFLNTCNFNDV